MYVIKNIDIAIEYAIVYELYEVLN